MEKHKKDQVTAFAAELNKVRDIRDMKQKQLAQMVNVSQAAVSQWLSGAIVPSFENVQRLEHALGLDVGHLESLIERKVETPPRNRETTIALDGVRSPRTITTSDIGTPEDVALILSGFTKEAFERLFQTTARLREVVSDSQKKMDQLRDLVASELPGTPQFDAAVTQMKELSDRMARERSMLDRQQVDMGDVDKMTERVRFVLGQTPLGQHSQQNDSTATPGPVDMTVQVLRRAEHRKVVTAQTGLRSALNRWRHPSTVDRDQALDELLSRLVRQVLELREQVAEQKSELAELRGEISNLYALAL